MLPPHLIDAMYAAHRSDARLRDVELERTRRLTPSRQLSARHRASMSSAHLSVAQRLWAQIVHPHAGRPAAAGPDDA